MTNEEAIIRLKGLYGNGYTEQEQALDMAIRALKGEQTGGSLQKEIDFWHIKCTEYEQTIVKMAVELNNTKSILWSANQTDGDLIPRQAVITMLQKIENAVEDGDGFQFNEWIEYAKDIPSAENTALKDIDCEEIGCNCENCKLYLNAKETRGNKPCK